MNKNGLLGVLKFWLGLSGILAYWFLGATMLVRYGATGLFVVIAVPLLISISYMVYSVEKD